MSTLEELEISDIMRAERYSSISPQMVVSAGGGAPKMEPNQLNGKICLDRERVLKSWCPIPHSKYVPPQVKDSK
jgi:hypothetical protein